VTSVIRHTVRAGSESRYESWFREVTAIAQTFPDHRGVDLIRPPKGRVLRFGTSEHLGRWLSSDASKRFIAEIEPYLEGGDHVNAVFRATTTACCLRERSVVRLSVTPSTKCSRSSPPMLANGKTSIERSGEAGFSDARAGVGFATAGTPTCNEYDHTGSEYERTGSAMFLSCVGP
jgi:hypothetical protein